MNFLVFKNFSLNFYGFILNLFKFKNIKDLVFIRVDVADDVASTLTC